MNDDKFENNMVIPVFPRNPMLGQSYVPIQRMGKTYLPSVGLKKGTIYPELVSPYKPGQSMEEIAYLKKFGNDERGVLDDER